MYQGLETAQRHEHTHICACSLDMNIAQSNPISRQTYTVDEVAIIMGVGRSTIYEAIRRGTIPAIRLGRRIVVPHSALTALLDATAAGNRDR